MALTDGNGDNGMIMPVQPMSYGGNWGAMPVMMGGYGNGGFGFGGDWGSLIVLFLIAAMFGGFGGGWGNGFGGGFGDGAFPWLVASNTNTDNLINAGFNQSATAGTLAGIQSSITNGFANAEVSGCNRAMDAMQTAYNNQISSLERSFATQTANTQAINGLQSQLADCCCENRLATANLSALVQSENCADREALSNGIRDIISAQTAGTQRILDMLCQDKIDAKNEKIQELQTQVSLQNLAASQATQTAALVADNTAQTQALIQRIAPYPTPSFLVGNPYGYGNYYGNGYGWNNCGCNGNF